MGGEKRTKSPFFASSLGDPIKYEGNIITGGDKTYHFNVDLRKPTRINTQIYKVDNS